MDSFIWGETPEDPKEESSGKASFSTYVPLTVENVNNHIYYYAPINTDRTLDLIKRVRELDASLRQERLSRAIPEDYPLTPIWLHIQSNGGSLFAGFSIADQLKDIKTPVYSIIEGVCASAATLLSISCQRRFILPSGFILIHQLSSFMWGKYQEFVDEMKLLEMAMERLKAFYAEKSNMKPKDVEKMLSRESWFDAKEALRLGLVDEIMGVNNGDK